MSATDNRGGYRAGPRDPYVLVGVVERQALERALEARGRMTGRRWRVFAAVLALTTTYAKLYEYVHADGIATLAGIAANHCYEELDALASLGLVVWRKESGHRGRRLLGLVDPAEHPSTWFKTAASIAAANSWAKRHLAEGAEGPAAHAQLARLLEVVEPELMPDAFSPEAGTKRVRGPGLKESRGRDAYQEVGQGTQVQGSPCAPDGARKGEASLTVIAGTAGKTWRPVKRGFCRVDEEYILVNGENLCERHWLEEADAA